MTSLMKEFLLVIDINQCLTYKEAPTFLSDVVNGILFLAALQRKANGTS